MTNGSPCFSVAKAYRMYSGPPEMTLGQVAREFNCAYDTLKRRFLIAGFKLRDATKRRPIPSGLDAAVEELLTTVIRENIPWREFDEVVRTWMYRPPEVGPSIALVRRNLQRIGKDLAVVPYADGDDPPEPPVVPTYSSGRTYGCLSAALLALAATVCLLAGPALATPERTCWPEAEVTAALKAEHGEFPLLVFSNAATRRAMVMFATPDRTGWTAMIRVGPMLCTGFAGDTWDWQPAAATGEDDPS